MAGGGKACLNINAEVKHFKSVPNGKGFTAEHRNQHQPLKGKICC